MNEICAFSDASPAGNTSIRISFYFVIRILIHNSPLKPYDNGFAAFWRPDSVNV